MRSVVKGLVYAAVGMALLVPVGITLIGVGIPLIVVGAVALAVMAVGGIALALPVVILGALMLGMIAAIFGIFAVILGLSLVALKLAIVVALVFLGLQAIGRLLLGSRPPRPVFADPPVRDRYEREADLELDRELGV